MYTSSTESRSAIKGIGSSVNEIQRNATRNLLLELNQKSSLEVQQFHDTVESKIHELPGTKVLTQEVSIESL